MKKTIGVFVVVLVSIGIADLLQGVILTLTYTPNSNAVGYQELTPIMKYFISAVTVTLTLLIAYKIKCSLRKSKPSVKLS
ncbi:hypothetical protein [Sporosarcina luteola]|uniref:hypothetical protein n=1 Tax=Sporosarcina luteola TaxID=582850 RepID=UPI00203BF2F2|nr:hypothetical protein [Sporosarcina luteola]MCM3712404.1 hypothetical protein [Sporosarcina luteola]